jgi:hypothetical protein
LRKRKKKRLVENIFRIKIAQERKLVEALQSSPQDLLVGRRLAFFDKNRQRQKKNILQIYSVSKLR